MTAPNADPWVPIEWNNDGTKPAYVENWQVFIRQSSLIAAVEAQGFIVLPVEGTCDEH